MLQRGLLANAGQQEQQQKPPYETTTRANKTGTSTDANETNLQHRDQDLFSSSNNKIEFNEQMGQAQQQRERINCLPIIEMPQIKIEQDMEEDYMEDQEEGNEEEEEEEQHQQQQQQQQYEQEQRDEEHCEPMDIEEQQERGIKPMPQLLEPTSILKTSLLTGAANTLATLTAAAEQIARMPNEGLNKNYPYFKEENCRTYTVEDTSKMDDNREQQQEKEKEELETRTATTTYTSILQTALMAKRPANLNVTANLDNASATATTKTLHVRTPDQVLKTAVTLATLSEIAAQQEQQQQLQQQQLLQLQQQQQQKQQPHILVVPQVATPMRKMCTLPFKKLNFANVTTTSTSSLSSSLASASASASTSTSSSAATATAIITSPNTASSITTTTNANYNLGSNLKTNINLSNNSSTTTTPTTTIITTNKQQQQQAASNNNNFKSSSSNSSSNSSNNSNNNNNSNIFKTQAIATQTLKIPQPQLQLKPHLVTSQTQTEEHVVLGPPATTTNTSMVIEHTSANSSISLTRTAVPVQTKVLVQNTSSSSSSSSSTTYSSSKIMPLNTIHHLQGETKTGHIFKHNSQSSGSSSGSGTSKEANTLTKMNIIKAKSCTLNNTGSSSSSGRVVNELTNSATTTSSTPAATATNVTVVVFETLLPED